MTLGATGAIAEMWYRPKIDATVTAARRVRLEKKKAVGSRPLNEQNRVAARMNQTCPPRIISIGL